MQEVARSFAAFHRWALLQLLAAVKPLPDADCRRDCGLYFHSLHGTLNHLLVGERTWYARFTGGECAHRALDEEAEAERSWLAFELAAQADRWRKFVDTLDDTTLGGDLCYRTMNGLPSMTPFGPTRAARIHARCPSPRPVHRGPDHAGPCRARARLHLLPSRGEGLNAYSAFNGILR
jgi:hypothetical protein